MSTQTEQAVRTITLYATKGGKKEKIDTAVTTWKELKRLARDKGFDVDKLHSTENVNRADLVNDEAILPASAFTLFMRPKQVKSGNDTLKAMSYKDIKASIKKNIEDFGEVAKAHYNQDKNYTTKSTEELRNLLGSFVIPTATPGTEEAVEEVATEVPVVEETVADAPAQVTNADRAQSIGVLLTEIVNNTSSQDVIDRASEILEDILPGLVEEIDADSNATSTNVADVVESVKESKTKKVKEEASVEEKESAEDIAAREKAEKEAAEKKAEEERIAAEKAEAARLEKEEDDKLAAEAKMFS